jgi:hypothetical protein
MKEHAEAIEKAERVRAELEARLAAAREALAANLAKRDGLAFAAATGDATASKMIGALAKEAATLADDIRSLEAAVAEAGRRVTAARLDADHEAKRQAARKAREVLVRLTARGPALDAGLTQVREAYHGFQDDLRELAALGAPAPSGNLIDVNSRRALDAAMSGLHSKVRPVPPLQQHTFDELCRGWARPSERWAAEILEAPTKDSKAA